ncbi:MAG: substrate-binding domain-containing protein [Lentisphaeria bacterium]|nr:substrate-binding domain-containing protein [Lentisphaeria bacterium]
MNRNNWFVIAVLAVSAVLMTIGVVRKVNSLKNTQQKVIAVIPKGTANMWWEVVHKGAEKAAKESGYEITWNGPEVETDREKQIQCVEDAIIKQSAAIVLGPNDFKALARSVEKIRSRKIPCVIIDSPVDSDQYDSFAGTDNYRGGAEAARIIGKKLHGKGNVILVRYIQNSASTDARGNGFVDTLRKEFPDIKIIAEQHTQGTIEDARQRTVDMLTKHSSANAVFAVNHPSSVGAYKAIQNEKKAGKICFVAFDSDPVLLEGVSKGEVEAIIAQNPFEIGYQGVKLAVALLKQQKVEREKPIASMIVRKENLDQMKRDYPEALGL